MNVVFGVIGVIVVILAGALAFTEGERREGRALSITNVDFAAVPSGTYRGTYTGGRFKWRANEVEVTVVDGKVTEIEILTSATKPVPTVTEPLFDRVMQAQSLKVDTISSATITSKSFLKSIEAALTEGVGH